MWQLISGLILIGIFFVLVLMLKRGYEVKEQEKKQTDKDKK